MKQIYLKGHNIPMTVEEYPTVEEGVEAFSRSKDLSTAFYANGKLWSLDRVTPYGLTAAINRGATVFTNDIVGTTVSFSLNLPEQEDLI